MKYTSESRVGLGGVHYYFAYKEIIDLIPGESGYKSNGERIIDLVVRPMMSVSLQENGLVAERRRLWDV